MTKEQALNRLFELAHKDHDYCADDDLYTCPKHPEVLKFFAPDEQVCNCGADKHNQEVDELRKIFTGRVK